MRSCTACGRPISLVEAGGDVPVYRDGEDLDDEGRPLYKRRQSIHYRPEKVVVFFCSAICCTAFRKKVLERHPIVNRRMILAFLEDRDP